MKLLKLNIKFSYLSYFVMWRLVQLDAILQDALEDNKSSPPAGATCKVSWEELMQKCMARMTQTYHLTATGPTTAAPPKGKLEPIDIRVSMRSGNKKVGNHIVGVTSSSMNNYSKNIIHVKGQFYIEHFEHNKWWSLAFFQLLIKYKE